MTPNTKSILILIAIFLAYGLVGNMDYSDQVAQEKAQHRIARR